MVRDVWSMWQQCQQQHSFNKHERKTGREVRKMRQELRDWVNPTNLPAQNDELLTQEWMTLLCFLYIYTILHIVVIWRHKSVTNFIWNPILWHVNSCRCTKKSRSLQLHANTYEKITTENWGMVILIVLTSKYCYPYWNSFYATVPVRGLFPLMDVERLEWRCDHRLGQSAFS